MSLKYWSVRHPTSRRYGYIGVMAETADEAVRIANLSTHTKAKRATYPGNREILPSGEYLIRLEGVKVSNPQDYPVMWGSYSFLGYALTKFNGYHPQEEVVRFLTPDEYASLYETRVRG